MTGSNPKIATTSSAHHSIHSHLKKEIFSCVGPVARRIMSVFMGAMVARGASADAAAMGLGGLGAA